MYNSLLNLKFNSRTSDSFCGFVLTRGACQIETENYVNQDLKKIERWATDNKIEFNDKKFKVLFISRKRNEGMKVDIYLNYKTLEQNEEIKYLGIYFDRKYNFNAHVDYTVAKLTLILPRSRTGTV